jgi:hypothetical protein
MRFITIIIFMFMGYAVSKQLAGGAAQGVVKGMRSGLALGAGAAAGTWAALRTSRPLVAPQAAIGRTLARIPGLQPIGKRLIGVEEERRAKIAAKAKEVERMSDQNARAMLQGATGDRKLEMARILAEQGRLSRIVAGDSKLAEALQGLEKSKSPNDYRIRMATVTSIKDAAEQEAVLQRMGTKQWATAVHAGLLRDVTPEAKRARAFLMERGRGEHLLAVAREANEAELETLELEKELAEKAGRLAKSIEKAWTSNAGQALFNR